MGLSNDQLDFLRAQNVPIAKLFDATGLPKWFYRQIMSEEGLLIAYGVTPCGRGGHTLRTRAGHCIQCDTSKIAFMRRWDEEAEVYIAYSHDAGLCKVGCSGDARARVAQISSHGYASANDWELHYSIRCGKAGMVEAEVHRLLREYKYETAYLRGGAFVSCYEVFSCEPEHACAMLTAALAA